MSRQSLSFAIVPCRAHPYALGRAQFLVAHATQFLCCDARPSGLNNTPCRDTGHGHDTGSKGLYCDRENLCHDPSHPIPPLNPVATPKFCRDMEPSNLCQYRGAMGNMSRQGFSFVIGPLPRHARGHSVVCKISVARLSCALLLALRTCRARWCTTLS